MGEIADMLIDRAIDAMFDDLAHIDRAFNPHGGGTVSGRFSASKPNPTNVVRGSQMVDLSDVQVANHPLYERPLQDPIMLEVGDIIRKSGGWTPMAVVNIRDGMILACYCGDYFDENIVDCAEKRNSKGFVLVTDPAKEFQRCRKWEERLDATQMEQLLHQQQKYGRKTKKSKRKSTMKTRTELLNIAALTSDELTTVSVYLDGSKGTAGCYTFLCKRSLALTFTDEDTKVLCETKHGLTIGIVKEIHPEVMMESMDDYRYRFVFAKIDVEEVESLNKWQESVADKLNTAQRKVTKRSALAALGLEESEMMALPSLSSDKVVEDKD